MVINLGFPHLPPGKYRKCLTKQNLNRKVFSLHELTVKQFSNLTLTIKWANKNLFYKKASLNIGKKPKKIASLKIQILTRNSRKYQAEIRQIA